MGRSRGKPGVGGRSDKIIGVSVARRKALRRHIGVVGQQNNSFLSELMVAWADQAFEPQHIGRLDIPVERATYCQVMGQGTSSEGLHQRSNLLPTLLSAVPTASRIELLRGNLQNNVTSLVPGSTAASMPQP